MKMLTRRLIILIIVVGLFFGALLSAKLFSKKTYAVPGQLTIGSGSVDTVQYINQKTVYTSTLFFGKDGQAGSLTSNGTVEIGSNNPLGSTASAVLPNGYVLEVGGRSKQNGVSIGTTANAYMLEVAGTFPSYGDAARFQGNVGIGQGVSGPFTMPLTVFNGSGSLINLKSSTNSANIGLSATAMTLDTNLTSSALGNSSFLGNLGVGTTVPVTKLHVSNGTNIGDILTLTGGSSNYSMIAGVDDTQAYITNNSASRKLTFGVNSGKTNLVIDTTGNVGIGTALPSAKLDITGTSSLIQNTSGNLNITPAINLLITQGNVGIGVNPSDRLEIGSGNIRFTNSSAYPSYLGTTDPSLGNFKIQGAMGSNDYWTIFGDGASNAGILHLRTGDDGTEPIYLEQGSNVRLAVDGAGNVGIGTTTAGSKLTVAGSAAVNGTLTVTGAGISGTYALLPNYAAWNAYGTGDGGAAVYNDSGTYKKLMIVGNNSAGGSREVGLWDNLTVSNNATVGNIMMVDGGSSSNWAALNIGNNGTASINAAGPIYSYGMICTGNNSGACNSSSGVVLSGSGSNTYGNIYLTGSGNSYFNGGNVGIGVTGPGYMLDVEGNRPADVPVIYGNNTNPITTGNDPIGIYGVADNATPMGVGVQGRGGYYGVYGLSNRPTTYWHGGVLGNAVGNSSSPTGTGWGVNAQSSYNSTNYGISASAYGGATTYGGYFSASGGSSNNWAVYTSSGKSYFGGGEVIAPLVNSAQFRAIGGNYGFMIRNDGSNTYMLLTAINDPYGSWNGLRPMAINNASGYVTFANGHADLAENYTVSGAALRGSLISIGGSGGMTGTVADSDHPNLIGVVTTQPGAVMDADGGFVIGPPVKMKYANEKTPVALQGAVPALVSTLKGTIKAGDAVTSSPLPGIGEKASRAGLIVGRALETLNTSACKTASSVDSISWPEDNGKNSQHPCYRLPDGTYVGKIMLFLSPGWYDPDVSLTSTGDLKITDVNGSGNFQVQTQSGSLLDRIGAYAEVIVARMKAGIIEARRIVVNGVDLYQELMDAKKQLHDQDVRIKELEKKVDELSRPTSP